MSRAKSFWQWFASVAAELREFEQHGALVEELDKQVLLLGKFGWELGPGEKEPLALVISPGGDRDRLALTRALIEQAPRIPGWEFHPAKPPKRWRPVFEMEAVRGKSVRIDASDWRYVLLRYPDGAQEVLVEAANLRGLKKAERRTAVEIALDGMLGEELRLEIEVLEVCTKLEKRFAEKAKPISEIGKTFGMGG